MLHARKKLMLFRMKIEKSYLNTQDTLSMVANSLINQFLSRANWKLDKSNSNESDHGRFSDYCFNKRTLLPLEISLRLGGRL